MRTHFTVSQLLPIAACRDICCILCGSRDRRVRQPSIQTTGDTHCLVHEGLEFPFEFGMFFVHRRLVLHLPVLLRWKTLHTSRAALRPETAAVLETSACLDCASVSPLGSVVILRVSDLRALRGHTQHGLEWLRQCCKFLHVQAAGLRMSHTTDTLPHLCGSDCRVMRRQGTACTGVHVAEPGVPCSKGEQHQLTSYTKSLNWSALSVACSAQSSVNLVIKGFSRCLRCENRVAMYLEMWLILLKRRLSRTKANAFCGSWHSCSCIARITSTLAKMQRRDPTATPSVMLPCTAVTTVVRARTSLIFQEEYCPDLGRSR